ncbi:hypothetical protein [Mycobacterium sp. 852002-51057_SCH5723018]|uniref:hypothetical protein n=1 Tax=Mycobacterium sp. 852002-51057_SCH5723018 TaxID=1834094 RepID=UPI000AA005B2|nr:hypothetical protein [Mycobacterium sp. 852002-51057_SCH5723018]
MLAGDDLVGVYGGYPPYTFDSCSLAFPSSATTGVGGDKLELAGFVTPVTSTF